MLVNVVSRCVGTPDSLAKKVVVSSGSKGLIICKVHA